METKCFFLEETNRAQVALRRYSSSRNRTNEERSCPNGRLLYHNAETVIGEVEVCKDDRSIYVFPPESVPHDDPRWPLSCDTCLRCFCDDDEWQINHNVLYRRIDTGEIYTLNDAPPGAMWYADWMLSYSLPDSNFNKGPDGHCLMVRCPDGHDWCVDGPASNCTMPDDTIHKCWVRHGTPPNITVDKNGNTCAAGAGSIQTRSWHGFLRNGVLL